MKKLIFFDIDGTIVMPGCLPSKATVQAIHTLRSNGHKVFLSTGRLESYVDEAVQSIGFDGGIYSAGGKVVIDGQIIMDRPMPAHLSQQIISVLLEENAPFMVESSQGVHTGDGRILRDVEELKQMYTGGERDFVQSAALLAPAHERSQSYDAVSVYKILVQATSPAQADALTQKLGAAAKVVFFPNLLTDSPLIPGEISDLHIHKGAALQCVCQYLKADINDCIAFGDSMNDAEILQAAGLGIAMGNADAHVKELADQVCESCADDGIAKMLARIGLI